MKKIILITSLLFMSISFAKERKVLSEAAKKEVINVLKINEMVHASFFEYSGVKAENSAKKLSESISKISDVEVKKLLSFAQKKALEIKASQDQKENNKNYNIVSMALIHIVNTYDVGKEYNAYSCPMVKKKWVQNSTKQAKVHNPYSAMMPHCGSKDTNH